MEELSGAEPILSDLRFAEGPRTMLIRVMRWGAQYNGYAFLLTDEFARGLAQPAAIQVQQRLQDVAGIVTGNETVLAVA